MMITLIVMKNVALKHQKMERTGRKFDWSHNGNGIFESFAVLVCMNVDKSGSYLLAND